MSCFLQLKQNNVLQSSEPGSNSFTARKKASFISFFPLDSLVSKLKAVILLIHVWLPLGGNHLQWHIVLFYVLLLVRKLVAHYASQRGGGREEMKLNKPSRIQLLRSPVQDARLSVALLESNVACLWRVQLQQLQMNHTPVLHIFSFVSLMYSSNTELTI